MPITFPSTLLSRPISRETLGVLSDLEVKPIVEKALVEVVIATRQDKATLIPLTLMGGAGEDLFPYGAVFVSAADICTALTKGGFIKARDEIAPIAYPTSSDLPVYFLLPPNWKTAWSNKKT